MKHSEFSIKPNRITVKWLQHRTNEELILLADEWEDWCCRGRMIREEQEQRRKVRDQCRSCERSVLDKDKQPVRCDKGNEIGTTDCEDYSIWP